MSETKRSMGAAELRIWLTSYLAQLLGMPETEVDPGYSFELYGLDSSGAVGMSGDLGDLLGCELDTSVAYDYPTIDSIVSHLVSQNIVAES